MNKVNAKGKLLKGTEQNKSASKNNKAQMEPLNDSSRGYEAKKNETCINCYMQNKNTWRINFGYADRNKNWNNELANYSTDENENAIADKENKNAIANSAKLTYPEIVNDRWTTTNKKKFLLQEENETWR